MDSKVQPN